MNGTRKSATLPAIRSRTPACARARSVAILLWCAAVVASGSTPWSHEPVARGSGRNAVVLPQVPKPASPVLNKISSPLRAVLQSTTKAGSPSSLSNCLVQVNDGNEVQVYVGVEGPADSRIQELVSAGMRVEICNTELGVIQGWLPRNAVETVAALPFVRKVSHPSYPRLRAGSVMTEGDAILGSNLARA